MFNIFIINYMTDCSFKNKDSWEGFSMMQHSMEIFTTAADYTTGCLETTKWLRICCVTLQWGFLLIFSLLINRFNFCNPQNLRQNIHKYAIEILIYF